MTRPGSDSKREDVLALLRWIIGAADGYHGPAAVWTYIEAEGLVEPEGRSRWVLTPKGQRFLNDG